jgi:hypothetical protein
MLSDQQSKHQPMVQGTLALKEVANDTPSNLPLKGPQLVLLVPPDAPEVSIQNSLEMTPARQFFVDLRKSRQATPPSVAKQPENPYESHCGQCGLLMIFRTPLTDWMKAFCGRCGESVWVR